MNDQTTSDEQSKCPQCGLPTWDDHRNTARPQLCKCNLGNSDNLKWEWACPRCGMINVPWMPGMPCCNCQK